ncbi:hypothetical protein BJX96DRAFT_162465 [Aspergillus floccosus]
MSRSNTTFKKPNLPWGFSIYRCSYKDDTAWHKMLHLIQQTMHESLLESHILVIHNNIKELNGATSHELPVVVSTPEVHHQLMEEHKQPRLNFTLFIDDICLEFLVHMHLPVVKILYKQWGNLSPEERKYIIDPDWHDGATEDEEEDVGWMYMSVADYVETYDRFEWAHHGIWHGTYSRPPQMIGYYGYPEMLPGFWRN